MSQFKPYPAYKDSGVEWLGEVPEHWTVTLLKRGYEVTLGKMLQPESKRDEDELLPYLRAANIQPSGIDITDVKKMWFSASEKNSLSLVKGDLLVSEGGDVGRSAIWELDRQYYFQNSINRIRSIDGNDTLFLYFWMVDIKSKGYIDVLCNKSTIAHFTAEKVAAVPLLIPLKSEQSKIANFLDHETARIDALIEEQKHLIELLKEKRQAVISHTVTKGLDPTVPMKDSGVEWLGQVPAHWVVKKLGFLGEAIIGLTYSPDDVVSQGVLVLRSSNVQEGKLCFDDNVFVSKVISEKLMVKQGDILICSRNGSRALIGKNALIDKSADGMTFGAFMTVFRSPINNFLHQVFNSSIFSAQSGSFMTSTVNQLTTGNLNSFLIPVPPRSEQLIITKKLLSFRADFEDLISEALASVKLLQERRSALISAAVTGKIDVRDWQPPTDNSAPSAAAQKTCLEAV